jgi:penicillin amidase
VLPADGWQEIQPGERLEVDEEGGTALSLRWDALMHGDSAVAFDMLARANGWDEFVTAVRRFSAPAQHFVYADVDGNIGYAMSGLIPIRRGSDGSTPAQAGETAEWVGSLAPTDLPAVLNPASGQIVTANNEVDRQMPHFLTQDWVAPFRARRIVALLAASAKHDLDAMERIQRDITSTSADWILTHVELPDAAEELRTWDRRVDERPVVALYEAFEAALWQRTFADDMSASMYERFYRYAGNERFAGLHAIINDAGSTWFDDRTTPQVERRADIARLAASDAVTSLGHRFGDRPKWRWHEMHAVKFSHPLSGGGRLLDWFFSRGPVPVVGDSMTVNKTTTNLRRPYGTSEAASYRQILDVGAWDRSVGVITTGQSGHPQSPHYFDQNILWREGRYRSLPFTPEGVAGATVSQLELVP